MYATLDFYKDGHFFLWGGGEGAGIKKKSYMVLIERSLEFGIEQKVFCWLELVLRSQSAWYVTVNYASIVADLTALELHFRNQP